MINTQEDTSVPGLPNSGNYKVSSLFLASFGSGITCYDKFCSSRLFLLWFYSFASNFPFLHLEMVAFMKRLFFLPFNHFPFTVGKLIFNHVVKVGKNIL